MTKIRKLFAWIWRNKERIVLIIMVAILCQRIYQVMNPEKAKEFTRLIPPGEEFEEKPPLVPDRKSVV